MSGAMDAGRAVYRGPDAGACADARAGASVAANGDAKASACVDANGGARDDAASRSVAGAARSAPAGDPARAKRLRAQRRDALRRLAPRGFNLLPHRERDARRALDRCLIEWFGGVLVGVAGVLALGAWQTMERHRLDAARVQIDGESSDVRGQLAEHAGRLRDAALDRERRARAADQSRTATHLLDLLDALGFAAGDGVVIEQLTHRERDSELVANARGSAALSAWLARLNGIRGVQSVDVKELRRAGQWPGETAPSRLTSLKASSTTLERASADLTQFAVTLRWRDTRTADGGKTANAGDVAKTSQATHAARATNVSQATDATNATNAPQATNTVHAANASSPGARSATTGSRS